MPSPAGGGLGASCVNVFVREKGGGGSRAKCGWRVWLGQRAGGGHLKLEIYAN